jgi:type I restriction enzyme, R subunit
MTPTGFSESATVQAAIVRRLSRPDLGWSYVPGRQLDRTTDMAMVESEVVEALLRLNPEIAEAPERVEEVLPLLRAVCLSAVSDGLVAANERMVTWLRGTQTHRFVGAENYEPIRLIDFDNPWSNRLVVSDEVTFGVGAHERRFDVVLWVNGFPLVVGETKTPVHARVSWLNGALDVHDTYEADCAAFFTCNVLSFATEGDEFHYGAVRQPPSEWLMWGCTTDPYDLDGPGRVMRSVELLLAPDRVLSILRDFTLFDRPFRDGTPTLVKLIPRYPQVEGVEAIHRRVLDAGRRKGLIWHYQGTGKTLLMAFAALRLLHDERVGGPTVLIVLDRLDLVEQTIRQFRTAGLPRMREAATKEELRSLLGEDQRGIIVTTIFRFEGAGLLNRRGNIIVLVDEAHRTQEGRLGEDMRAALPNAQFFGLTGTPIADQDRNIFKLFGDPDDPSYVLNQYSIERSIADGSSVPVHVETRLVDFHIDKEALDEAFEAMAEEEQLDDEQRELLAEKASSAKTFMRNPDRIRTVCSDIVDHYFAKVAPLGMKAQVVAFDRELCVRYHEEIGRLLAERGQDDTAKAEVVMTVGTAKDEPLEWRQRYELSREAEARLQARFSDHGDPLCFLIVTAKLLTGFDAPIEGVMYLDKPLRLHTLFQAITRTNRRWRNPETGQEKHYGLVVDYVGLGNEIARALRAADPETGGRRPVDVDGLLEELAVAMQTTLARFEGIDRADRSFEALLAAQQRIPPGEARDTLAGDFVRVEMLWEFLHPNPSLDRFKRDYRWLAQVYESVKPKGVSDALLWHRLGRKTLELVHGHITDLTVTGTGLDEVIVDAETVEAIRQLTIPGTDTTDDGVMTVGEALDTIAARLRRRLATSGGHPVYLQLSERLERLRLHQLDQAQASVEFLRELLDLAQRVTAAEKADDEGRLDDLSLLPDPNIGALTQILREYAPPDTPVIIEEVVQEIDSIVKQVRFTGWTSSQPGDRAVRKELKLALKKFGLPTTGELFDRAYGYIRENY